MDFEKYSDTISKRLESYFEIKNNIKLRDNTVDIFATANMVLGRTMITQKDIIDKFISNEYVVVKYYETITDKIVEEFQKYLIDISEELIQPSKIHKSSYINGVLVCNDDINEKSIKKIKSFKHEKIYKWYFHGFSEIRIFTISLKNNSITSNNTGKRFKKVYKPTP